jgi:hypothetical protein
MIGDVLTIKQFAARLELSVRTVRRWIADPHHPLPCYKPTPKTIFIRIADFEVWFEASRREGRPAARQELERMLRARRSS